MADRENRPPLRWAPALSMAIVVVITLSSPARGDVSSPPPELTYEQHIRPLFRTYCFDCHGATDEHSGGLDLRLVRSMRLGGESGPAISPGDASSSYLLQRIVKGEMPPGKHRVPAADIATIETWIAQGAKTARAEPQALGRGLGITPEERNYWAFQPIVRPPVPSVRATDRVRTPIDAFLLAKMEPQGLTFAADAAATTLVRRAYVDLLGLPPTPTDVTPFANDPTDASWKRLIDELLASPHYGERWGRHWLDVAGYAESEGDAGNDSHRPWAFKYRDFVIRSFNRDMPFDEFIVWQLAGDELVDPPFTNLSPRAIEQLTATGFLRMAADPTASNDNEETRNASVADTLKIVSSSLLGLSVGCAQCHDHRYDPISHDDYHRLRAVFEPSLNFRQWRIPSSRLVSLWTDADRTRAAEIEKEAQAKQAERSQQEAIYVEEALQGALAKCESSVRKPLEEAYRTSADQRTDAHKALLALHPNIASFGPGVLYQYNQAHADALKGFDRQIGEIRNKLPPPDYLHCVTEAQDDLQVPVTHLFHRGDFRQPKHEVTPGAMAIESPEESPFLIPLDNPDLPSTGRRLAYARWLTSGRHPLTARVLVNRIWLHHFGVGLAPNPDEFGKLGAAPSHPELLDWLADEFMASGWSVKHIHRLILQSTAFRQSSTHSLLADKVDGANVLYSHFPVRRLEAEAIRDSILAVADRLDRTLFGKSVDVTADAAGQTVVEGDRQRRSIYIQARRSQPMTVLVSFDAPVMQVNCAARAPSTSASQSLLMMNGDFVWKFAEAFAQRVSSEAAVGDAQAVVASGPESASTVDEARLAGTITRAWQLALCRSPTSDELQMSRQFIGEQAERLRAQSREAPEREALTNFCQVLFNANEFLYLD